VYSPSVFTRTKNTIKEEEAGGGERKIFLLAIMIYY
jgi:hypothetical protein